MNKNGNFAVVRRPSSAVEKAVPGAKRILSGMVADALALAKADPPVKPILSMLVGGGIIDGHAGLFEDILRPYLESQYNLKVMARDNAVELIKLAEQQPFDLFIIILNNVWQDLDKIQLDATDGEMWGDRVMFLKRLKMQFGKPIIALSGIDTIEMSERSKRAGADVFLSLSEIGSVKGFQNEFLPALETALKIKIPRDAAMRNETMSPKTHPLKIILVDDENFVLDAMEMVILDKFKNVTVQKFREYVDNAN
jgi:DNA-binding NarL/FixJ family response regulator